MNKILVLTKTILIFTLFFIMIESIYSINIGFTTDSVTENEFDSIIKSKKVELLNEDPKGGAIECFAVSENGLIALGFAPVEDSKKFVGVYNSNFEFLYAYAFNDSGSFGIAWDNENLVICSVRENDLVSVSPHGEITEIAKIQDTIDNSRHWREKIEATEQTIQGVTYKIQNVGLTSFYEGSYSQLVKINENNEIQSQIIGELVMNKLKELDAVAYVRFASVYREFKDINTFMDELKKVLEN